jgi:7-cyano-7-deazaguanine synthase in queuosine biosynthesis
MVGDPPDVLTDLLEIAAYVHCADQIVSRGGEVSRGLGADWRRDLRFIVPVREPDRWSSPEVRGSLQRLLGFMSDDTFRFEFVDMRDPPPVEGYLNFGEEIGDRSDEVLLFSGGLDSLAGAVDRLCNGKSRLLLVSHQSSTKIADRQYFLASELANRFPGRVLHVPVRLTKHGLRAVETTQRSRSFLFGALAALVSSMSGTHGFRCFENGIVSFNLPIAGQVVGTAATRTTHPRVIRDLSGFLSTLGVGTIEVENPFLWLTKAEVAELLCISGHADLAKHSVSCSRVHEMTRLHTHCGCCSQCLDRRFGALAGGLGRNDPEEMYETDLLTGTREKAEDRVMSESFVRHALELQTLTEEGFIRRFAGEIGRAAGYVPRLSADEVAQNMLHLHRRHAGAVRNVLEDGYHKHAAQLAAGTLPPTSLLRLAAGPHGISNPAAFEIAVEGVPPVDLREFRRTSEIRLALDSTGRRIVVGGVGPIEGPAIFILLRRLVAEFDKDRAHRRAPENHTYLPAKALAHELGMDEASLRRGIFRVRKRVADAFVESAGLVLTDDALIESRPWKGYRLNPAVVLVSPSEVAKRAAVAPCA